MKKNLLYLGLTGYLLFALCTRLQAQTDSLQAHRYVTRATMYGVGFTNVFDTYLSPQEYKGIDFRISRETIRMTKLFDGNVSWFNSYTILEITNPSRAILCTSYSKKICPELPGAWFIITDSTKSA